MKYNEEYTKKPYLDDIKEFSSIAEIKDYVKNEEKLPDWFLLDGFLFMMVEYNGESVKYGKSKTHSRHICYADADTLNTYEINIDCLEKEVSFGRAYYDWHNKFGDLSEPSKPLVRSKPISKLNPKRIIESIIKEIMSLRNDELKELVTLLESKDSDYRYFSFVISMECPLRKLDWFNGTGNEGGEYFDYTIEDIYEGKEFYKDGEDFIYVELFGTFRINTKSLPFNIAENRTLESLGEYLNEQHRGLLDNTNGKDVEILECKVTKSITIPH